MRDQTAEDRERERAVFAAVGACWGLTACQYAGEANPIDGYLADGDRVVALVEVKCRDVLEDTYPTVYLSVRKWLALLLGSMQGGVLPLFVVRFDDGAIRWLDVRTLPPGMPMLVRGRRDRGYENDREPVLEVPIPPMAPLDRHPDTMS